MKIALPHGNAGRLVLVLATAAGLLGATVAASAQTVRDHRPPPPPPKVIDHRATPKVVDHRTNVRDHRAPTVPTYKGVPLTPPKKPVAPPPTISPVPVIIM